MVFFFKEVYLSPNTIRSPLHMTCCVSTVLCTVGMLFALFLTQISYSRLAEFFLLI